MTFCIVMILLHIVAQWKESLSVFEQGGKSFVWWCVVLLLKEDKKTTPERMEFWIIHFFQPISSFVIKKQC